MARGNAQHQAAAEEARCLLLVVNNVNRGRDISPCRRLSAGDSVLHTIEESCGVLDLLEVAECELQHGFIYSFVSIVRVDGPGSLRHPAWRTSELWLAEAQFSLQGLYRGGGRRIGGGLPHGLGRETVRSHAKGKRTDRLPVDRPSRLSRTSKTWKKVPWVLPGGKTHVVACLEFIFQGLPEIAIIDFRKCRRRGIGSFFFFVPPTPRPSGLI